VRDIIKREVAFLSVGSMTAIIAICIMETVREGQCPIGRMLFILIVFFSLLYATLYMTVKTIFQWMRMRKGKVESKLGFICAMTCIIAILLMLIIILSCKLKVVFFCEVGLSIITIFVGGVAALSAIVVRDKEAFFFSIRLVGLLLAFDLITGMGGAVT